MLAILTHLSYWNWTYPWKYHRIFVFFFYEVLRNFKALLHFSIVLISKLPKILRRRRHQNKTSEYKAIINQTDVSVELVPTMAISPRNVEVEVVCVHFSFAFFSFRSFLFEWLVSLSSIEPRNVEVMSFHARTSFAFKTVYSNCHVKNGRREMLAKQKTRTERFAIIWCKCNILLMSTKYLVWYFYTGCDSSLDVYLQISSIPSISHKNCDETSFNMNSPGKKSGSPNSSPSMVVVVKALPRQIEHFPNAFMLEI